MQLRDMPFVMPLAEWIWGGDAETDGVSRAERCLSQLPLLPLDCFKRLLTKGLGLAIIAGSMLNKVPIMVNMMRARSAAGIERKSLYGEAIVYVNGSLYGYLLGYPFTAFGENVSLLCQNVVLISLCWSYSNKTSAPVEMQEKVSVIVGFLLYNMAVLQYLPEPHWSLLMSSTWPVMMYARCSQIWGTFQAKSTGNLSIATTSMNLVGACIRILTTLQETGGDFYVLGGYLLSGSLSFIMFGQYWLYLKNTLKTSQEEKAKKAA